MEDGAAQEEPRMSLRQTISELERACRANDPSVARQALMAWSSVRWPDLAGVGLEAMRRHCGEELWGEIERLNRAVYGRGAAEWRGEKLWKAFRNLSTSETKHTSRETVELEPLYRL
jgi:hypothetical protein